MRTSWCESRLCMEKNMNHPKDQALILVADDTPEFRERIIPKALERLNARVLLAKDVLEAFLIAMKHDVHSLDPLDLVVLDMHMPLHQGSAAIAGDAGIRFLRSCRILPAFDTTICPVVVFTAYPSWRDCVRAVQAGAAAYLPKQSQDTYWGQEGGIDLLIDTCRALLTEPQEAEKCPLPLAEWMVDHYDWLRQEYRGRWVAFVAESKAQPLALAGVARDGVIVVSGDSQEELARRIALTVVELGEEIPPISLVPPN